MQGPFHPRLAAFSYVEHLPNTIGSSLVTIVVWFEGTWNWVNLVKARYFFAISVRNLPVLDNPMYLACSSESSVRWAWSRFKVGITESNTRQDLKGWNMERGHKLIHELGHQVDVSLVSPLRGIEQLYQRKSLGEEVQIHITVQSKMNGIPG